MISHVNIWKDAPELAIPEDPTLFSDSRNLWLAYETTQEPSGQVFAVIQFVDVIDHRLSPINDEGLGQHPCASASLKYYAFNEVIGSIETQRWAALAARHWVITFKDKTLDVVARSAQVVHRNLLSTDSGSALLFVVSNR